MVCPKYIRIVYATVFVTLLTAWCQASVQVRPASEMSGEVIDWMKKVADWQLTQSSWNSSVSWERGALHAGLMACYEATRDETYLNRCREYAAKFNWQMASNSHHADNNAVGQDYMELYFLDVQDPGRYAHFKSVSDAHIAVSPAFNCDVSGGSEMWWWCDALFMAPPGLVRLSRALNDPGYTAFMHRMWGQTQDCLYDTQDHLFFRDINYLYPAYSYNGQKVFWSRGNGWVIAGTARVLQYLPLDDPERGRYTTLLQEMSAKLATIQLPDGYWHSDLLSPQRYANPETSGTGFFTYSIAWGINNGLLDDAAYWPTAAAGWEALKAAVQPNGLLGWVQPVGADPRSTSATTTDVFGVGAYLLAGSEVLKYLQGRDPNSIEFFESYTSDAGLQAVWADGDTNGTVGQVTLGDYGDNFMQLSYQNDQAPHRSQADYTFAAPKDFAAGDSDYLSILVRGNASNTAEVMYVRLEDGADHSCVLTMMDTSVVQTAGWMELGFPLSDFAGIDLTQIKKISIGVGLPDAILLAGQGTLRIDNICLRNRECTVTQDDFNGDCSVDMADFAVLAGQWLDMYAEVVTPTDPGTANLAAYWPLDTNYDDVTGHGYDALAGSSVVLNSGHLGQSAYFNGNNYVSYLECQNSTGMNVTGGATISAWVKTPGLIDAYASVVTKGVQAWRLIRNNTAGSISFHFNAAGTGEYQANGVTSIMDNQWHHLMGVYDGSTVRLYVDGQLDAWGTAGPVKLTTDPVYIGSRVGRTTDRNWVGWIDDVRIYDTALMEANLLYLAEQEPIIRIPDPRPTDLVLDGMIDIQDLAVFVQSWLQDSTWP
ncbi:MAG: glycoside hydrolase family 88 protein [Anaerohalosphaeraceae bacterium]